MIALEKVGYVRLCSLLEISHRHPNKEGGHRTASFPDLGMKAVLCWWALPSRTLFRFERRMSVDIHVCTITGDNIRQCSDFLLATVAESVAPTGLMFAYLSR